MFCSFCYLLTQRRAAKHGGSAGRRAVGVQRVERRSLAQPQRRRRLPPRRLRGPGGDREGRVGCPSPGRHPPGGRRHRQRSSERAARHRQLSDANERLPRPELLLLRQHPERTEDGRL